MRLTEESIYARAPFAKTLGMRFPELSPHRVRAELTTGHELSTGGGNLHGGAIMSLSDVAGAVLAGLNVADDHGWTTAESTTYFLRPLMGPSATAVATPIKVGRMLINVDIDVFDESGKHCSRTSQVIAVQAPRD
ncbi:MAG TPA: PaaI family thioesterase [Pseudonocardia sp.]|jgi:uncharacterized protein (TIGR00369 family)|nr:PaaI family thioesterase [Pseudonocardia sp.]